MSAIVNFNQNEGLFVIASGLLHRKSSFSLNLPVILTFCHIANLFECMAMFYFVKWLSALRIITEPCADRILLFGRFPVLLHHALDVGGFGRGEDVSPYSCITLLMSAASDGAKNDLCCSVPKWIIASMARLKTSLAA